MRSHTLGRQGEAFALEFLKDQGCRILATNYRTKVGEIDIVADDNGTLVFVEVKARQEEGWDPFEAVTPSKQRKIIRTATWYLVENFKREDIRSRFDVLAVYPQEDGGFKGKLLKNAFFVR